MLNDTAAQRQQSFTDLSKYFSQEDIANLTLSIVQINSWNRLAKPFGFEAGSYKVGQHKFFIILQIFFILSCSIFP